MISRETIKKILLAGCAAPSGGNSQPWEFEIENNTIKIFSNPEKDHPILNVDYRGTWMAHGALIENISIAASKFGINIVTSIFPQKDNELITSFISLQEINSVNDSDGELFNYIFKRTTNRKHYLKKPIPDAVLGHLKEALEPAVKIKALFFSERVVIDSIAKSLSVSEKVMFGNKKLHNLFFKELVWNKRQEEKRGGGLLLDTLELKGLKKLMLRFLQYWPIMFIAIKIGMVTQISKDNAETHLSCGLLCAIKTSNSKNSFLEAGRQIQRIWLTATKYGLSLQINTGLFFLWQGINENISTEIFSVKEKNDINVAYNSIASLCNIEDEIVTAVLRIGYGGEPSSRSIRSAPIIK